jgi:aminoglycoside phosphotransferase (APT) family kinase protein
MIPEEKSVAVTRGLQEAFGVTTVEDIQKLTKGQTSSLVFRIVVRGSPYVMKIIFYKYDPTRYFTCMTAAAEAGLAPRVRYTNIEDRICITEYVDAVPLPVTDALVRIPAVLRTLHALPPFPRIADQVNTSCMFLINKGPALDAFLQRFQSAKALPSAECEELLAAYAQLAAVYPRDAADMVSSHNDLFKPDNFLFDGERVWLVDWEAAFLNDRYADLAVVANSVVTNAAQENVYLREYFGQAPNEYQLARFFLMQQLTHVFYAMAYVLLGSSGEPVSHAENAPEFHDFQRRMWAGEIRLEDKETKAAYGRIHLERLLQNMRQARFRDALRIVAS